MNWMIVAVALGLAALLTMAKFARGPVRSGGAAGQGVVVDVGLSRRLVRVTAPIASAAAWSPSAQRDAPPGAAAIEAALIAGDAKRALELAETGLATDPASAATHTWLAWALVANDQPQAAVTELDAVGAANAGGATAVLASYVRARAEHLVFEHDTGAVGAVPPLITTADLAVLTLASGRGGTAWLKGNSDVQIDAADARGAIAEHRRVTGHALGLALDAYEAAPGFADAGYLCARLAVKAGLVNAGIALFGALKPHMVGRPDADAFTRDATDLANPAAAVAAAKTAPVPASAKRSRSLKVL